MPFDNSIFQPTDQNSQAATPVGAASSSTSPSTFDDSIFANSEQVPSQTSPSSQAAPNTLSHMVFPENDHIPISTQINNNAQAMLIGGFHGEDRFATTLMKLGAKTGLGPSAEAIQDTYNANTDTYNKSLKDHPIATMFGDLAGTTIATAPAMLLPSIVGGAGIGSLMGLGKMGVNMLSMGAQGAAMGGVSTSQGQDPNTVWNSQGAKTGALYGMSAGAIAPGISAYGQNVSKLAASQDDALYNGGYAGKQFFTDLPSNSWIDSTKKWVEQSILQKFPGIMGTGAARNYQGTQIQNAVTNYISNLSTDTAKVGPQAVGNILKSHATQLYNQEGKLWDTYAESLPDKAIPTPTSDPITSQISQLIANNKPIDTGLKTADLNVLKNIPNYNTPAELTTLKRQVWDVYSNLQDKVNRGSDNPVLGELADHTRNLYWGLDTDLQNGLKTLEGNNSPSLQAYNEASAFTRNLKGTPTSPGLMDPRTRPQLIAAVKDSSDQAGKVSDFMKWLNAPTTSSTEVAQASRLLGASGQQEAAGYGLQQLYQKSMSSTNGKMQFNIGTFLDGLNGLEHSPQQQLYQPAINAMSGLRRVATDFAQATNPDKVGVLGNILKENGSLAGAAGLTAGISAVGLHSPAAGAILLTPVTMSLLASNSTIKNALIQLSKLAGSQSPSSLFQYLSTKAVDTLTRAGVQFLNENGSLVIDKPQDKKMGTKSPLGPTSLNDYSPLVPHSNSPSPQSQVPQPISNVVPSTTGYGKLA